MGSMEADKQRLEEAFTLLDAQRGVLEKCTLQWKELTDHYASLEESLQKKFEELAEKEKNLELKTKETEELLDKREQSIESNEETYLARLEEQKNAALAAIESGKSENSLKFLCEKMDAEGLWRFIVERRKDVTALRAELPSALESAIDPARLVLQALEGFYDKGTGKTEKKDSGLGDQRRACSLLLESLLPLLADPTMGAERPVVSPSTKEQARVIANEWKSRIDVDADPANAAKPLEVQAFLQLVATFGIAAEFPKDDLCKLVLAVSWRRQIPKLCGALGLTEKMPDIVEELINKGKQVEAVYFAHAAGLFEKFPPVPLLKAYLKNSKKATLATLKSGNNSAAVNEANTKELTALKTVIKCIEEHNLESLFPTNNLQNRVADLEKKRAERKKSGGPSKSQNKRSRSNAGGSGAHLPPAKAGKAPNAYGSSNISDRSFYRPSDMVQYPVGAVASYNLPGQSNYDRSSQAIYGSSYGGGSRSPATLSKGYAYPNPSDDIGASLRGSGSYNTSANYNSYHFGSGVPPPGYQSSYMQ